MINLKILVDLLKQKKAINRKAVKIAFLIISAKSNKSNFIFEIK